MTEIETRGRPLWSNGRIRVYDEIKLPPISYLVEGMIKEGGHHLLVGKTGAMKSYHLIDVFSRIANGMDVSGRKTKQADAVIVVGEALDEFVERRDDFQHYHGTERRPFIIDEPLQLHDENDMDGLEQYLKENPNIKIVAFDTLSNCSTGVKINEPDDVTAKINPVMSRFNRMGVATYLTHHMNKDGFTMRGAQALIDHTDVTWMLTNQTKEGVIQLREEKLRRGSTKKSMWFVPQSFRQTAVLLPIVEQSKETDTTNGTQQTSSNKKSAVVSTETLVRTLFDEADEAEILTTAEIVGAIDRSRSSVLSAITTVCNEKYIEKISHGKYKKA